MAGDSNESLSNSTLSARLVHRFDPTLRYTGSVSLAWQPEPNYSNGIANSRRQGDYLYAYISNAVSKAWTPRWSSTVGLNLSTLQYQEEEAEIDNRSYLKFNVDNRFKWTERLAVSLNYRFDYCQREWGSNTLSNFVLAGVEYALDENTTATLRVGPQFKNVEGHGTHTYPSMEFGLNHRVSDRFRLGTFVRYANEATDTYRATAGKNYSSNETWRIGVNSTLKLTHRVDLVAGVNFINSDYSRSTMSDTSTLTLNAYVGVNMMITNTLYLTARYSYTNGQYHEYNYAMPSYNRNVFSVGMNYTF